MSILFEPYTINGMKVENRFVKSAMVENMSTHEGEITDDIIKMYRNWSKGGIGLIITGYAYIQKGGNFSHLDIGAYDDKLIPGLRRMADAVHEFKGKIAMQIFHCGIQTFIPRTGKRPIGPSVKFSLPALRFSRKMSEEEIYELIENFGDAALRAKMADFDAVQIHAAHGWLISEFLSRYFNRRKDKWGGSLENRMRVLIEIYKNIRKKVGDDYPVLIKINGNDAMIRGINIDEVKIIIKRLSDLGIDSIEISGGIGEPYSGFYTVRGGMPEDLMRKTLVEQGGFLKRITSYAIKPYIFLIKNRVKFEEGYFLHLTREIRKVTDVPLMAVGGIRRKEMMESIIKNDKIEFVSLARPLVREPNLPNKIKEGKTEEASCTSCNRCYAAAGCDLPLKCYCNERSI